MPEPLYDRVRKSIAKRKESETPIRSSPVWVDNDFVPTDEDRLRITAEATEAVRKALKKYVKK